MPSGADPGAAFTAIIQIGTELAVLLYFRRDVKAIITSWVRSLTQRHLPIDDEARMGWLIIVGSVPIVVLGFLFKDQIETQARNLYLTASMLILFAALMWWADSRASRPRRKQLRDLNVVDGIGYGFAQALALIPGVSRSGGTITAGLFMGYSRSAAARYSFLLAMPAVFGAGVLELVSALGDAEAAFPGWGPTIVAAIVAFFIGYLVIIAFLKIVSTFSYKPFVYYRFGLGVIVLLLLSFNVLTSR
jgi:undecaprenyl-diphosphatase